MHITVRVYLKSIISDISTYTPTNNIIVLYEFEKITTRWTINIDGIVIIRIIIIV